MKRIVVPWTGPEVIRLRKLYPEASRAEIEAALPRHGWNTIGSMANYWGVSRKGATERREARRMLDLARAYFRPVLEGWGERGKRTAGRADLG